MSQIEIKHTPSFEKPLAGYCAYGFDMYGKPVYIKEDGSVIRLLFTGVEGNFAPKNILANGGFLLEDDLPEAFSGYTYVTTDTFIEYKCVENGVWIATPLQPSILVTDTSVNPSLIKQFTGDSLLSIGGSETVLASNVITTPTTSLISTNAQSMFAEIDGRLLSGTTTEKTTLIDADSVGIWDSVASSFKRVTFANVAAYVLGKLSFATQAEAEAGTNTAKYMNPLRSFDGFKFWIANTQFAPLTTTSKTVQGSINEINAKQLTGSTTEHTTLINADSFGVWDSVNNVFKRISAAGIKAYVKFGLKASEVLNDSAALGATVKDVLDAAEAVEVQTVQDGDIIAMARDNNGVSENVFVKTENAKPYFAGAGNGTFIYVSTADEFVSAIGMEYSIIEICVTKPITVNPFSNVYADKVYLTGCEIALPDNIILLTKTSAGTTTDYLINNSLKYHVTDPASSVIVVTAADKTWNITARNFDNNELVAMTVLGAGSAVNLITGNTVYLNVPDSSGTYTATVDTTLDLGQDDIRLDGSNVLDYGRVPQPTDYMLIKSGNYSFELMQMSSLQSFLSGTTVDTKTHTFTSDAQRVEIGRVRPGYELVRIEATADVGRAMAFEAEWVDLTTQGLTAFGTSLTGADVPNVFDVVGDLLVKSNTGVGIAKAINYYIRNVYIMNDIIIYAKTVSYGTTSHNFKVICKKAY